jgi:hypothetical protein
MPTRFRLALTAACLAVLAPAAALLETAASAVPTETLPPDLQLKRRFTQLQKLETPLVAVRHSFDLCREAPCLTPSEAAIAAFEAGPERKQSGRFILDVRGGGPANPVHLDREGLFYLNSEADFRRIGVLVLAIEPDVVGRLLGEDGALRDAKGRLDHRAFGRMMARFKGKRLIVDGELSLQLIQLTDVDTRLPNGTGYHQVWVRVTSPDHIRVVPS